MDKEKLFFDFLDTRKSEVLEEAKALMQDDRRDESNVLKAKANIYDIFRALWSASKKMAADEDSFRAAFEQKIVLIPAPWEASLEKAKENNDVTKVMIEEAKLSAVAEVREKVKDLF